MNHELKTISPYFESVQSGDKTFEIRYDTDRNFQRGDTVMIRHYDRVSGYISASKPIELVITYVTHFEQKPGWCVFGFVRITDATKRSSENGWPA